MPTLSLHPHILPTSKELQSTCAPPLHTEQDKLKLVEAQESRAQGIKRLLSADVAKAEEDKAARKKAREAGEDQPRLYNRDFVCALDWALLKANGWGLAEFLPRRAVGRLELGDTRYFSKQVCPIDGSQRNKACIQSADGKRCYEVPCIVQGGVHHHPVAHLCQDMGPKSWPGSGWLMHGLRIRGT